MSFLVRMPFSGRQGVGAWIRRSSANQMPRPEFCFRLILTRCWGQERRGGSSVNPASGRVRTCLGRKNIFRHGWGSSANPPVYALKHSGVHPGPRAVECELARRGLLAASYAHPVGMPTLWLRRRITVDCWLSGFQQTREGRTKTRFALCVRFGFYPIAA